MSPVISTPSAASPIHAAANGDRTPVGTSGSASPAGASSTAAAVDEEKQRLKRERLEAWKKKKAAEAAAAAAASGSGGASPAPSPKPEEPKKAELVKAAPASPAPASPASAKAGPAGLPAKPVAAMAAALPSKPVSLSKPTSTSKPAAPAATPADATAAAAAAAAAISSRLSTLSSVRSNPLSASLPAKPTFSLAGTTALRSSGLKNSLSMAMGGDDDDDGRKKPGMIKIEGDIDMRAAGAGSDDDSEEDEEDLEGGAAYRANAHGMREARMAALRNQEGADREEKMMLDSGEDASTTAAVKGEDEEKMDADAAAPTKGAPEEDDEEDELEAYMKSVQKQVRNVDKADQYKMAQGRKGQLLLEPTEPGEDEDQDEGDENELDKVGTSAQDILALAAKKVKKGRELAVPDHSKIDYLPFRKAFYTAPPEVANLSQEETDALRLELDDIKVRGADPPQPATKWSYFGLPAACIDVIKGLEYAAPTSIQAQAIPAIMSGRDIIGVAKTGSGKTMAFILPMFRHIKDQPPLRPLDGPIAMIMTPTRELATQIYKECKPFLKALGLRASCAYGGMPLKDNIADMKRGSEVIVCTPGRMIELLTTNSGRLINLQRVTYLVLDEADRMFDMGFEPQVMKIIGQIRPDRQTVLFSATFPRQMEALARKVLRRPLEITVGGRSVVADTITQIVEVRDEDTRFNRMLELLGKLFNDEEDARALVFVERQETADKLFVELKNKNYTCMPLHGGREQVDRDQTIVDFKNGSCPIVIATSVAARGLDVKQLKLVIQYDPPNHMEDYVHRAGRTGRAGNTGTCVTFITPEQERYSLDILKALQASNAPVPPELEEMAKSFAEKVKAGKAQAAGSGFGGKGLERLDTERDAASRAERAAYGETAKDEKKEEGEQTEAEKTAQNVADLQVEVMRGPAPNLEKGKSMPTATSVVSTPVDKKAADEAAKKAEQEALAAGKSAGAVGAASVIAKFNAMLKARKQSAQPDDNSTEAARRRDPDATDFHAIIWINDYPQKARWKVTNKDTMVHLVESTGASITAKGTFYEAGKEPGPNDLPKLHLLIESNEEFRVQHAIQEVKKALVEGATMALEAEQRQLAGGGGGAAMGRYQVV
ncbi:pre-mRNA-processing ATP-dependent RNA helicase DDX46/PRP5 [Rhodotorula toruloides]|uniref:RNA helicase n=1 Tax=Rhodotorula toruloides TaxID=5286 RepID=A0A511KDQ9_RHOTO|nr:pre-mRNA-processing ATP-dependent RNA helicase DDX46/PRP5 [Rhodotorula toruloides]